MAYSNRGNAYSYMEEWNKAIDDYSTVLNSDPKNKQLLFYRGIAFSKLRQWDKAITYYNAALEIDSQFTLAITNRQIAYQNKANNKTKKIYHHHLLI